MEYLYFHCLLGFVKTILVHKKIDAFPSIMVIGIHYMYMPHKNAKVFIQNS